MGWAVAGAALLPQPVFAQAVVQQVPVKSAGMKLNDALGQLARNPQDLEALIAAGRASLELGDVSALIDQSDGAYDAILLDVDNGPDGLTRGANNRLYSARGLAAAHAALRPGGILAVWSAAQDVKFAKALGDAGFAVDEVAVRARSNGKGARHLIWFAAKRR